MLWLPEPSSNKQDILIVQFFFKSFFLLPLGLWVYDYVNIVCDAEQTLFYLGHRFVARFIDLLYHIDIVYK